MEDNLNTISWMVEKLYSANLVQNRIFAIVLHIVGDNRWKSVPLHGEQSSAKQNAVLATDEILVVWHWITIVPLERSLKNSLPYTTLYNVNCVSQRFDNGLPLKCLNGQRLCLCWHDDESNYSHLGAG